MITLSKQEQMKLDVTVKVLKGSLCKDDALGILNVSERTIRRYINGYNSKGIRFVKHGNCNRHPVNKTSDDLRDEVMRLVKDRYYDFNMQHCLEQLKKVHKIILKRETFRKWCHQEKMVKRKKRRRGRPRYKRLRTPQRGLFLMMDGSHHRWFGNIESCLIAVIDDADSKVLYAEFFPAEDTISCMTVLQKVIEKYGIFSVLYVDRAGIFGGPKRVHFSQVQRALGELNINVLYANSAEAKGRIERMFNTFQDRLIPEMRIRNINRFQTANFFLQKQFVPNCFNKRFTVTPSNLSDAFKKLPKNLDLSEIFCLKDYRTVARDHTFSLDGELFIIQSKFKYSIWKQPVEIRTYQNLSTKVFFADKPIVVVKNSVLLKSSA